MPTDIDDLIDAYRAGASISQLAVEVGLRRITAAGHVDRHSTPRHGERTAWGDEVLDEAAELYGAGSSLADVVHDFGMDPQMVTSRFRRAGVPVRPRRGWSSRAHPEQDRR